MELNDVISYEPKTGLFRWKSTNGRQAKGEVAGSIYDNGYRYIRIGGKRYRACRLAWFLTYGVWPKELDHTNRNKSDDRLSNLKECTHSENMTNVKVRARTKEKGITLYNGRYLVRIGRDYIVRHIGSFGSLVEAIAARDAYLERLKSGIIKRGD